MTMSAILIEPFVHYGFMRRALVSSVALGLGFGPLGVLLMLRRMSMIGDAISHAVLPGAAIAFLVVGSISMFAMWLGSLIASLIVAFFAGIVSQTTILKEDASFASFYLMSLALGVLILSLNGSNIELLHVLFGTILAVNTQDIFLVGGIASFTLITLALIYRPLVVQCYDPSFLRSVGERGSIYHLLFLFLVVINLVAGFQALGSLMAVGMMILPAVIAKLWARTLPAMTLIAAVSAVTSGFFGLLASYHLGFASGPSIIISASLIYILSLIFAPYGARTSIYNRSL
ncbi:high-affinity zinc transport system permease protein [Candidatus Endolissoclinum faulkneri L5]|uniref:High-affinity zinc transport system permease protein n=1 Tax=Candidatus Endolissoclinum faulkneri L5 TaxID=1401328 RepID=V9TVT0_9PROT|nr:metal ABC transporter permease [Candidatus Endolissoclinum faulkneri]AHC73808.1 high-affinity zinc transport system permease protein [Candidatus Endolissoclinum faulkneri L5]